MPYFWFTYRYQLDNPERDLVLARKDLDMRMDQGVISRHDHDRAPYRKGDCFDIALR